MANKVHLCFRMCRSVILISSPFKQRCISLCVYLYFKVKNSNNYVNTLLPYHIVIVYQCIPKKLFTFYRQTDRGNSEWAGSFRVGVVTPQGSLHQVLQSVRPQLLPASAYTDF